MHAVIYARLSAKPDDLDNIPQQLKRGHETAERMGWTVVGEYRDEGRSAWRDDVEREDFQRLLADARRKRFDRIIVREMARLTRNFPDWGQLVAAGVDVADWSGRVVSGIEAAVQVGVAAEDSAQKSIRGRAGEERRVERGQPPRGGRRAYGFHSGKCCDDCEPHTIRDDEAAIVREVVDRWLAGATFAELARDLNARGVPTSAGKNRWTGARLKKIITSPRIAAIRTHKRREVRGNWSPIISAETRTRVLEASRERSKHQRPHEHYLLRGFVRCGRCDVAMQGRRHSNDRRRYRCPECLGGIAADATDDLIWAGALGRTWDRDRASEELARTRLAEVKRQRVAAINKRDELDEAYWELNEIDRRTYDGRYGKLSQRIKDLDVERKQLERQLTEVDKFWTSLLRMTEHYESATFDEQRAVLRRAIDRVTVEPHGEVSDAYPVDSAGDPITVPAHFNVRLDRVGVTWR